MSLCCIWQKKNLCKNKLVQTAWMCRLICAFVVRIWHKQVFSWCGSIHTWLTWLRTCEGNKNRCFPFSLCVYLFHTGCLVWTENSSTWDNLANLVMPSSYRCDGIFNLHLTTILVSGCACVPACIHSSKTVHARVLKFHIWIPHGKIVDGHFFFLSEFCPFLELCPFEKIRMKSDACHILWTVHARVLKFHIWIPHGKIADTYFFSSPSYLPFWSYTPLKKSEWNLTSKVSGKVF